jgi:hypothetical protein
MAAIRRCCRALSRAPASPPVSSIAVSTRRRARHARRGGERALARAFPDALLFHFAKTPGQIARDFKWLGSYRYGILHLGGRDAVDLRERCAGPANSSAGAAPVFANRNRNLNHTLAGMTLSLEKSLMNLRYT